LKGGAFLLGAGIFYGAAGGFRAAADTLKKQGKDPSGANLLAGISGILGFGIHLTCVIDAVNTANDHNRRMVEARPR
jgi:hypothetical protein